MREQVPTENDWGDWSKDVDLQWAHKTFFGKTNDEVQQAFARNVIERADELRFMPCVPFRYYIFGLVQHIESLSKEDDWFADAASTFISLIEEKVVDESNCIAPIFDRLLPALDFLASNQERLGIAEHIYGRFSDQLERIKLSSKNFGAE